MSNQPVPKKGETFKCDMCGDVYTAGRSDEEAMAEKDANFPNLPADEPCGVVCDDCYKKLMARMTN